MKIYLDCSVGNCYCGALSLHRDSTMKIYKAKRNADDVSVYMKFCDAEYKLYKEGKVLSSWIKIEPLKSIITFGMEDRCRK
jgi:hypothetical protein